MFEQVEGLVDVDTYMAEPYNYWQFEVDREKATRDGVTVESDQPQSGHGDGRLQAG